MHIATCVLRRLKNLHGTTLAEHLSCAVEKHVIAQPNFAPISIDECISLCIFRLNNRRQGYRFTILAVLAGLAVLAVLA